MEAWAELRPRRPRTEQKTAQPKKIVIEPKRHSNQHPWQPIPPNPEKLQSSSLFVGLIFELLETSAKGRPVPNTSASSLGHFWGSKRGSQTGHLIWATKSSVYLSFPALSVSQMALQRCNVNFLARFLGWILEGEFWEVNFSRVNFSGGLFDWKKNNRVKNSTQEFGSRFGRPKFVSQNSGPNSCFGGAKSPVQKFVPDLLLNNTVNKADPWLFGTLLYDLSNLVVAIGQETGIRAKDEPKSLCILRCCFAPASGRNLQGHFRSSLVNLS